MVDPRKRDAIDALLGLDVNVDETPAEAEAELRSMGVDVDGFRARARERRAKHEEAKRTAWLRTARAGIDKTTPRSAAKYATMSHEQLVADFQSRKQREAQAYFHKLEKINDDDLRTLLTVDNAGWREAIPQIRHHYAQFDGKMPAQLSMALDALEERLAS